MKRKNAETNLRVGETTSNAINKIQVEWAACAVFCFVCLALALLGPKDTGKNVRFDDQIPSASGSYGRGSSGSLGAGRSR